MTDTQSEGFFSRLTKGLGKSSSRLAEGVAAIFTKKKLDDETLDDLGLDTPFDLLGLYRGVSLDKKEGALIDDVDMVFLYRRPILDYWCETGEPLARIVTHVLIHEIGHHFGFSDADMEAIEAGL